MTLSRPWLGALALGSLLAGCGSPDESGVALQSPTAAPVPDGVQRGWRRMGLDQLDASIQKVTGGIAWTDEPGNNQWVALAETLGAADYVAGTAEDLSVSLLFLKFLEDAAGDVCGQLVEREAGGKDNVFLVHAGADDDLHTNPQGVRADLSHALLRFHGRPVAPDSPQLEPWVFLFESATLVSGDPRDGWHTVCAGLLTHPDFYTY